MNYATCAFGLLLGLAACHGSTKQTAATDSAAPAGPVAATYQAATNSPGTDYRVYRALLPGQADSITLHLVTAPQPLYDTRGPSCHGSYYGSDGHPYEVQSIPSAPDSLVLSDLSLEHGGSSTSKSSVWRFKRLPGGSLAGVVVGQEVHLRRVAALAGSLTLVVRYFADSLAAFPNDVVHSPKIRINLQALVPVGSSTVERTLQANIVHDMHGDTLANAPSLTLPALFKQQRDTAFQDYRQETTELAASADTADFGTYRARLNYQDETATYVLYQGDNLLSLGFFGYTYSGGAHGNYGTTGASYDLRTGRCLRYDDIFLPTAAAQLPALLGQAVRSLVGLKPSEPLDGQLFVKQMPVTHNVFLTSGGVAFIYEPYEIAAYAQGEVRVFLPLAAVQSLLREGLPLPGSTVAKR